MYATFKFYKTRLYFPFPNIVNLSCACRHCSSSQIGFCYVGLPFFPSASWPLSFLFLFLYFFLFCGPYLIHARMPFCALTHFLAFMKCAYICNYWYLCMELYTFLFNLTPALFVSFIWPYYSIGYYTYQPPTILYI